MKVKDLINAIFPYDPEDEIIFTVGVEGYVVHHTNIGDISKVKQAQMHLADGSTKTVICIGPGVPTHSGYNFKEIK